MRVSKSNGFYISAHDADTEHEEGATYLWSYEQLENELFRKNLHGFQSLLYFEGGKF